MERNFEEQLCLGGGIAHLILLFMISLPNGFVLFVLLKNPLRCPRRSFTVFLAFICATDLFVGLVVSSGEAVTRFLCAFVDRGLPQEGSERFSLDAESNDVTRRQLNKPMVSYIGVNSSILLVTALSIDRFIAVVFPHTYRQKWKPKTVVVVNLCIVIFSSIFASIQLSDASFDMYLKIDLHLHTTFPLCTTSMAYLGTFFFLKKQSRIVRRKQITMGMGSSLNDRRQERKRKMERKFATTSFLILLFLILSLIPYFTMTIVEIYCESCSGQHWFLVLKESCIVFLHFNSVFNPFLASFRISELKRSCAIVLGLQRQVNDTSPN
ncbi:G-protein coupled receptor 26 [Acropora cervicornis]|uniref:G-protein coupled receptor 26 n=1 Tax=Acropora cervicornis TaxID=6130 RepID=A0AAD9PSG1_ACRCE|nr:G-protein coupled receptor 26 [Acropora cervicornis]